ncbi:MAG: hypothetical protein IJR44_00520 [Neisseriaceae bacterium]|nr:hypothetical protein [Neisseriaceae bacterium]
MTEYHFLPEISSAFKADLMNMIGSCRLESLEPTPETVVDLQLVHLGQKTHEQIIANAIERVKNAS